MGSTLLEGPLSIRHMKVYPAKWTEQVYQKGTAFCLPFFPKRYSCLLPSSMLFDRGSCTTSLPTTIDPTCSTTNLDGRVYVYGYDTPHMNLNDSYPVSEDGQKLNDDNPNNHHETHLSPNSLRSRFIDRHRLLVCHDCRLLWDTASLRSGGAPGISINALGFGSRFFHQRSLQDRICYNPRPFADMSQNALMSYKRLASVFELNWAPLEPITCCAGDANPVVAAALVAKKERRRADPKWIPFLCGGAQRSSRSISSPTLRSPRERSRERRRPLWTRAVVEDSHHQRRRNDNEWDSSGGACDSHQVRSLQQSYELRWFDDQKRHLRKRNKKRKMVSKVLTDRRTVGSRSRPEWKTSTSSLDSQNRSSSISLANHRELFASPQNSLSNQAHVNEQLLNSSSQREEHLASTKIMRCEAPAYLRYDNFNSLILYTAFHIECSFYISPFILASQRCSMRQLAYVQPSETRSHERKSSSSFLSVVHIPSHCLLALLQVCFQPQSALLR